MRPRRNSAVFDAMLLLGVGGMVYGLWLAWHPLGFIVGGGIVAVLATMLETSRRKSVQADRTRLEPPSKVDN